MYVLCFSHTYKTISLLRAFIGFLVLTFAGMIVWLRYRRMQLERTHYIVLNGEAPPGFMKRLGLPTPKNQLYLSPQKS